MPKLKAVTKEDVKTMLDTMEEASEHINHVAARLDHRTEQPLDFDDARRLMNDLLRLSRDAIQCAMQIDTTAMIRRMQQENAKAKAEISALEAGKK